MVMGCSGPVGSADAPAGGGAPGVDLEAILERRRAVHAPLPTEDRILARHALVEYDVPALVAEVRRLREERAALLDALSEWTGLSPATLAENLARLGHP
jgi:hypothetical protein